MRNKDGGMINVPLLSKKFLLALSQIWGSAKIGENRNNIASKFYVYSNNMIT